MRNLFAVIAILFLALIACGGKKPALQPEPTPMKQQQANPRASTIEDVMRETECLPLTHEKIEGGEFGSCLMVVKDKDHALVTVAVFRSNRYVDVWVETFQKDGITVITKDNVAVSSSSRHALHKFAKATPYI